MLFDSRRRAGVAEEDLFHHGVLVVLAGPVDAEEGVGLAVDGRALVPTGVEAGVDQELVLELVGREAAGQGGRLAVNEAVGVRIEEVLGGHGVLIPAGGIEMAAFQSQLVVLQGAVQLGHGQAVETVAVVPAAIPLRARNRLHEAAIGAVHQVGAVAVVDTAIVFHLGHALANEVDLVELELIAIVVAHRTVEAVERVGRVAAPRQDRSSRGCQGVHSPAKDRGRVCRGLPRPAFLLPSSPLPWASQPPASLRSWPRAGPAAGCRARPGGLPPGEPEPDRPRHRRRRSSDWNAIC